MNWKPISEIELLDHVICGESKLNGQYLKLWDAIKIPPTKWQENSYGKIGNGFWAVGVIGQLVLWHNDIEDGFNISKYTTYGLIDEYWCNQDELDYSIMNIYRMIENGIGITGQCSGPFPGPAPGHENPGPFPGHENI